MNSRSSRVAGARGGGRSAGAVAAWELAAGAARGDGSRWQRRMRWEAKKKKCYSAPDSTILPPPPSPPSPPLPSPLPMVRWGVSRESALTHARLYGVSRATQ